MAEDATAVNDAPITDATDSASVETRETTDDTLDPQWLDEDDLKETSDKPEDEGETEETSDEDAESVTNTEDTEGDEAEAVDNKPTKEEKRQDYIRNLVNERNELKRTVAELNARTYIPDTQEELQEQINPDTGENYTALEARVIAAEQRQELRDYNDQVAEAQLVIQTDAQNVITEFQWADEKSKEFNKDIAPAVDQLLANNLIRDPNTEQLDQNGNKIPGTGQIVGQHLPTYQLYKLVNDAMELGKTNGVLQGQKSTKKMLANADTPSSGSPKETKKDAFLAGFDKDF